MRQEFQDLFIYYDKNDNLMKLSEQERVDYGKGLVRFIVPWQFQEKCLEILIDQEEKFHQGYLHLVFAQSGSLHYYREKVFFKTEVVPFGVNEQDCLVDALRLLKVAWQHKCDPPTTLAQGLNIDLKKAKRVYIMLLLYYRYEYKTKSKKKLTFCEAYP